MNLHLQEQDSIYRNRIDPPYRQSRLERYGKKDQSELNKSHSEGNRIASRLRAEFFFFWKEIFP